MLLSVTDIGFNQTWFRISGMPARWSDLFRASEMLGVIFGVVFKVLMMECFEYVSV